MACKMNWDWVGQTRCIVYTTFRLAGIYSVKIMLGEENNSPRDKPWKTGTVKNCKSHIEAAKAAIKWAEKEILAP